VRQGILASKINKQKGNQTVVPLKKGFAGIFSIWFLIYRLKQCRPDLLISWLIPSNFIASVFKFCSPKTKIIWYNRAGDYTLKDIGIKNFFMDLICRKIFYKIPACAISNSRWARKMYQHVKDSIYLPNPVPYFREKSLRKIKLRNKKIIIGCLARYHPQKDHETLLRSLEICKSRGLNFKLLLAGPNIQKKNTDLVRKIEQFNLQRETNLLGPVNNCSAFFRRIDLHILSSSFGEGFPNVLVEACAHENSVVATNVGEAKEICNDQRNLCPPKNPMVMANLILQKALDHCEPTMVAERKKLRIKIYQKYNLSKICAQHHKFWNSCLYGA